MSISYPSCTELYKQSISWLRAIPAPRLLKVLLSLVVALPRSCWTTLANYGIRLLCFIWLCDEPMIIFTKWGCLRWRSQPAKQNWDGVVYHLPNRSSCRRKPRWWITAGQGLQHWHLPMIYAKKVHHRKMSGSVRPFYRLDGSALRSVGFLRATFCDISYSRKWLPPLTSFSTSRYVELHWCQACLGTSVEFCFDVTSQLRFWNVQAYLRRKDGTDIVWAR